MNLTFRYELFIYHAPVDTAWVEGFLLRELGLSDERVLTPNRFESGASYVAEYERAVTQSRYILLVLTPDALARDYVRSTHEMAAMRSEQEDRDRIIPLLLRPCTPPAYLLRPLALQLDCTHEAAWNHEITRLREYLNLPEPAREDIACPYPGMIAYTEQDAEYFFGRDYDLKEVCAILNTGFGVLLSGPSGAGKSSFVRAGLLPALDSDWCIRRMRPGATPGQTLEQLLEHSLAEPEQAVAALLAQAPSARQFLLIVDQLEELFTQTPAAKRAAFITDLRSLTKVKGCQLLLVIRSDFLEGEGERLYFGKLKGHTLFPLRGAELRQAIEEPAALLNVYFEAGLLNRILSDADADEDVGVLPLMQEMMKQLWPRMHRRLVPFSAYEEMSQDGRTGLATAIETSANQTFATLSEDQQQIAIRIFLRLVQFTEGRKDTRRRQAVTALRSAHEDTGAFNETLRILVDSRLLVSQSDSRDPTPAIDLAHEELLRSWFQLKIWVETFRDPEQRRRNFELKVADWHRHKRNGAWLDTPQLKDAQKWLADPLATNVGFSTDFVELVTASHALSRKATQQRFSVIGLVMVLVLIVVGITIWSQWQAERNRQTIEENQRRIAQQQQTAVVLRSEQQQLSQVAQTRLATKLVAQSQSLGGQQPDLALLLGMAAYRLSNTADAHENILGIIKQNAHLEGFLHGHTGRITSIAFSPDGKRIASSSADGTVKLWDVRSRSVTGAFTGYYSSIAFEPKTGWVVGILDGARGFIWRVMPEARSPYRSSDVKVRIMVFSKDGQYIAAGGCRGEGANGRCTKGGISLYGPSSSSEIGGPLVGHTNVVNSVSISPNNQILASASEDGTIILWNIASNKPIGAPLVGQHGSIYSVVFSPDGSRLASGTKDGTILLWDAATRQLVASLIGHTDSVQSVAFSPDGTVLASGSRDKTLLLWNATTGQRIGEPLTGHQSSVYSVAFSPDGSRVVSGDDSGGVILWNMTYPTFLTWNKAAQRIIVDSTKDSIEGVAVGGDEKATTRIEASTISPDGRSIVMGLCRYSNGGLCVNTSINFWDLLHSQPVDAPIQAGSSGISGMTFSPDGTTLATINHSVYPDKMGIQLWNTSLRQLLGELLVSDETRISSIQFRNYGKQLISSHCAYKELNSIRVCAPVELRIWDVATQKLIGQPAKGPDGFITAMAFNSDGTMLAVAECVPVTDCYRTEIRFWDVEQQKYAVDLLVSTDGLTPEIVFSPDGRTLAATIQQAGATQIKLWDVAMQQELGQIDVQNKGFTSLAFASDGLSLIAVTNRFNLDSQVMMWQVELDDTSWQDHACQIAGRDLEVAEWDTFVGSTIPYDPPCAKAPPNQP